MTDEQKEKVRRVAAGLTADDVAWLCGAAGVAVEGRYAIRDFVLNSLERSMDRFGGHDRGYADRIRKAVKGLREAELHWLVDHADELA